MSYELGKESEINVEQNIMVPILLLREEWTGFLSARTFFIAVWIGDKREAVYCTSISPSNNALHFSGLWDKQNGCI